MYSLTMTFAPSLAKTIAALLPIPYEKKTRRSMWKKGSGGSNEPEQHLGQHRNKMGFMRVPLMAALSSPIPNLYFILVTLVVFIDALRNYIYIYSVAGSLRPEISRPGTFLRLGIRCNQCATQRATRCGQHPSQLVTEASVHISRLAEIR